MPHRPPRTLATAAAVLTTAALGACGSSARASSPATTAATGTVVAVVAGENVWGDIARQIGGAHVAVTSIISDPDADPHTYETDPRAAAAIGRAGFVVRNGVGYDDFLTKLLDAGPRSGRTVLDISQVCHVTGSNPNPHLWYDPTCVEATAQALAAALTAADPADTAAFTAGERVFLAAYQPYVDTVARIKAAYAGTRISFTERVPGYLVDAAGLVLGTPVSFSQAVEDGQDPSPGDTAAFRAALEDHTVKVLLYNGQVTDAQTDAVKALATAAGVPVVAVTETLPPSEKDFQTWQLDQARQLLAALGG